MVNSMEPLYHAKFSKGEAVRIRKRPELEQFAREWKFHNPLTKDQLQFAGEAVRVVEVGFYHGGDRLYQLEGVPGVWHEECLAAE